MESQILDASARGQIEGVVLRYGLFYGPDNATTEQMIALARRRLLPTIRGDRGLLPFIHLDDAASATVAALDRAPRRQHLRHRRRRAVSLSDMVPAIAESVGAPRPIAVRRGCRGCLAVHGAHDWRFGLPLSNAKARAELGWRPAYPTIRDGLSRTVRRAA